MTVLATISGGGHPDIEFDDQGEFTCQADPAEARMFDTLYIFPRQQADDPTTVRSKLEEICERLGRTLNAPWLPGDDEPERDVVY